MVTEGSVEGNWRCPALSRVVHNVNNARKFGKYADVTFIVGPDGDSCTIKAHRVVVGTANDELAKLVSGSDDIRKIRISDVSPRGFKNLLRFLYDIDVKFSDLSTVRETRLVAEKFKVYKLKVATDNFLHEAVEFEPILEMLQIAIDFEMPKLESKCIDIISTRYQNVLKSEQLVLASFDVLVSILSTRPCRSEICQYETLLAIGNWMNEHHEDDRLRFLIRCVDFTLVRIAHFNDFVEENEGLLSDADIRALQKYILSKKISDAPKWYQPTEDFSDDEEDCIANTEVAMEKDISEKNYLKHFELQKSKVQKTIKEEMRCLDKALTEATEVSAEMNKIILDETVREIVDYFSFIINEAVETVVGSIEDELKFHYEKREEKGEKVTFGEKEPNSATEISVTEIGKPFATERCSTDTSCIVPKYSMMVM